MPVFKLFQIAGLTLDMIGVIIIFIYSPINNKQAYIGTGNNLTKLEKRKNKNLKIGLSILLLGLATQLIGIVIQ